MSGELKHPTVTKILKSIRPIKSENIQHYPHITKCKQKLAHQLNISPAKITLSAGSDLMF